MIKEGLCNSTQIGQFILQENATSISRNPIITKALDLKDPTPIKYNIKKTGYYCVWTYGYSAPEYKGVVEFRNSYGELPAAQIAKLPFYGGLTIVYAVIGAYDTHYSLFVSLLIRYSFWAFLYVQNRHDICGWRRSMYVSQFS